MYLFLHVYDNWRPIVYKALWSQGIFMKKKKTGKPLDNLISVLFPENRLNKLSHSRFFYSDKIFGATCWNYCTSTKPRCYFIFIYGTLNVLL